MGTSKKESVLSSSNSIVYLMLWWSVLMGLRNAWVWLTVKNIQKMSSTYLLYKVGPWIREEVERNKSSKWWTKKSAKIGPRGQPMAIPSIFL